MLRLNASANAARVTALALFTLCLAAALPADIIVDPNNTGARDVLPADPTSWTLSTTAYVGWLSLMEVGTPVGEILVNGGSNLYSRDCYLGQYGRDTGTITIDQTDSLWTNSNTIYIGLYGNGTLNITNGGAVTSLSCKIGDESISTGVATIDGAGSIWTNSGGFTVAEDGHGTLNITNGGFLNNESSAVIGGSVGSTGIVNVNNATWTNSSNLYIGYYGGNGTLNIANDGSVTNRSGNIGHQTGSIGTVVVNDSTWTNSQELFIGRYGNGTLSITNGGSVSNTYGYIGKEEGSTGVVTVDNSTWTNSRTLSIGSSGNGTLNITNGGSVQSCDGYIGSTGVATVDGIGSTWTNDFDFDINSHGSLNIENGGAVNTGYMTTVHQESGSHGVILFNNGTLNTNGLMADSTQLTGTGTINANGLLSDKDIVFDSTHGLIQSFTMNENVTLNLNVNKSRIIGAGYGGVGTIRIADGLLVSCLEGYIGYKSGASGTVTVDGTGSKWSLSGYLHVGFSGNGTLNIINDGEVQTNNPTIVSENAGSQGHIHFDDGLLNTPTLFASSNQLTGTGTIITRGLVSDVDLVFDSTHGTNQTFTINENVSVNLDIQSWGILGAGYNQAGSICILDGQIINTGHGYIGYKNNSTGTILVEGSASEWSASHMHIGFRGNGTLNIKDGGRIASTMGCIAWEDSTVGEVTVNGTESQWSSNSYIISEAVGEGR